MSLTEAQDVAAGPVVVELSRAELLRRVLTYGFAAQVVFFAMDATLNHAGVLHTDALQRLVNTTREDALPSWFAVTQTFCVGLIAAWTTLVERGRRASPWVVAGWAAVSACFLYLALDDGSALHERFGTWFSKRAEATGNTWFPSYGWQVLFAPVFGSMGLFLLGFLWRQLGDAKGRVGIVGAIGLLFGAEVMDFLEGLDKASPTNPYALLGQLPAVDGLAGRWFGEGGYEMVLHFSKSTEECIEACAMTVILWVLLRNVLTKAPDQRWSFV